jgi:hypothetical protein
MLRFHSHTSIANVLTSLFCLSFAIHIASSLSIVSIFGGVALLLDETATFYARVLGAAAAAFSFGDLLTIRLLFSSDEAILSFLFANRKPRHALHSCGFAPNFLTLIASVYHTVFFVLFVAAIGREQPGTASRFFATASATGHALLTSVYATAGMLGCCGRIVGSMRADVGRATASLPIAPKPQVPLKEFEVQKLPPRKNTTPVSIFRFAHLPPSATDA